MVVEIKKFKKEETAVVTSIDVAETFGKRTQERAEGYPGIGL